MIALRSLYIVSFPDMCVDAILVGRHPQRYAPDRHATNGGKSLSRART
jgi:hypothetical protein